MAQAAPRSNGALSSPPGPRLRSLLPRLICRASGERRAARKRLVATIRWRAGPQAGWRIRLQGTDYEIMSIEAVDGKERFMTLVCEEVSS